MANLQSFERTDYQQVKADLHRKILDRLDLEKLGKASGDSARVVPGNQHYRVGDKIPRDPAGGQGARTTVPVLCPSMEQASSRARMRCAPDSRRASN